ncbi:MAG: hypothetical protein HMLKMBBP_02753 [Planctomycetes bacterium]|nr:hypothetical protein [Planctomycetota bacterium]
MHPARPNRFAALVLSAVVLAASGCTSTSDAPGVPLASGNATTARHLRERIEEMRYMHGQELLARMDEFVRLRDDAVPALREAAGSDDWLVRSSVMWILGAMADRRNIDAIHGALGDPVPAVRYQSASSLVKLGDPRGFPVLVTGLSDPQIDVRYKCFQSLKAVTGQDFGYRHDADPVERRDAVARWLDWLDTVKTSAL